MDLKAKREEIRSKQRTAVTFLDSLQPPSIRQYREQQSLWERFTKQIEPDALPDFDNLRVFIWWCAKNSRGKLSERADVKTLCYNIARFRRWYNETHSYQISMDTIDDVKEYLVSEAAGELGLQDLEYDKEFASWKDIKIMLHFIIVEDPHVYVDIRLRAQLVCLFLIISDDGERVGAILRSESYRDTEVALIYQDIEIFLRPASSPDSGPEFRMVITYNNRKGERGTKELLVQDYYQRNDRAHCLILWILVLAFLDDAFDNGIMSPEDLFNMKPGVCERRIRFKKEILHIPIFRRMPSSGSRRVSPNLPWSSNSVNAESQRIVREAGFPQRWTFYAIRRGMASELELSNVSVAKRKRLMGHTGKSDKVFRRYYEARRVVIDTGNIFRKEAPRPEKSASLSMHLQRDPNALVIPHPLLAQTLKEDEDIQNLLKAREELQLELLSTKDLRGHGTNHVSIESALIFIRKALNSRRVYLKNHTRADFRKRYFQDPELTRSQYPSARPAEKAYRGHLEEVLYPTNELEGSVLETINVLLVEFGYTPQTSDNLEMSLADSDPNLANPDPSLADSRLLDKGALEQDLQKASTPNKSQKLSQDEEKLLLHLRDDLHFTWSSIIERFPGRSKGILFRRYEKIKSSSTSSEELGAIEKPQDLLTPSRPAPKFTRTRLTPQDDQLLMDLKAQRLTWLEIGHHFPGRSLNTLTSRYKNLKSLKNKVTLKPDYVPRGPEVDRVLIHLKENQKLSWPVIAAKLPGPPQLPDTVKHYYHTLKKRTPLLLQEETTRKREYSGALSKPKRQKVQGGGFDLDLEEDASSTGSEDQNCC